MRLIRIGIDGLLSFEHEDLSLRDGLTVIVGPNAAGKTNLLRLLSLAGIALEWVEERSSGSRGVGRQPSVEAALASYAAARHRHASADTRVRLELGLELNDHELNDVVCFMQAAVISTVMTERSQSNEGPALANWVADEVTPEKLAPLARGTLVLEHEGSPDTPWRVFYEFGLNGTTYRWSLTTHRNTRQGITMAAPAPAPEDQVRSELLVSALFGVSDRDSPLPSPLPSFDLRLLCPPPGKIIESQVQFSGGSFDPDLWPHRRFAELVGVRWWTGFSSRPYSLGWVLHMVFQRSLVMIGEQLRGVAPMATPPRPLGRYSLKELVAPSPNWEPYALPLRLLRLKNGSYAERKRFRAVRQLFNQLAPGRTVDLRMDIVARDEAAGNNGVVDANGAEAAVTVLIAADDGEVADAWELPVQQAGAGTWEALVLAEALADSADRVIILDEPALNLYPGWQELFMRHLRERTGAGQFVVITHSPYLLPLDEAKDIYRLVRAAPRNGSTQLARIAQPVRDPDAVIQDYRMSADARALLFASGAILVEGPTELGSLPMWFAKSQTAKVLGDPRSLHLAFYAVDSETHFKAPLTLLAALRVPWVIVCDGGPFRPDCGRNHIFRQVEAAGAGGQEVESFIKENLDNQSRARQLQFEHVVREGRRHGIFTLAKDWDRTKVNNISAESFEAFADSTFPGQLAIAKQQVGYSKVRKGRWLADNNPCPSQLEELYRDIVHKLISRGMSGK